MSVKDFGKLCSHGFQSLFEPRIADQLLGGFDGGGLALDVGQDVGDFRNIATHVRFELGYLIVGLFESHAFVKLNMLLHVQVPGQILHADVMHVQIPVGGDGANAVKNVLRAQGARKRLHGHIGIGQNVTNRVADCRYQLARTLEGYAAGEAHRDIGKIPVAGAADAYPVHFQNAIHVGDSILNLGSHSGGGGVEQRVNRAPGQTPAYGNNHTGHKKGRDRVRVSQPFNVISAANQNQ